MKLIYMVLLIFLLAAVGHAKPIRFIHTGTASGVVNGNSFTATPFVITAWGNTDNRARELFDSWYINHDLARIELASLGTYEFTTETRTIVSRRLSFVSFAGSGIFGPRFLEGPFGAAFESWDMLSSIDRQSGTGEIIQSRPTLSQPKGAIDLNIGPLTFEGASIETAFTATIIPEPISIMLAAIPLLLLMRR